MVERGIEVPVEAGLARGVRVFHVRCEVVGAVEDFAIREEAVGGTVAAADGVVLADVGGYEVVDMFFEMV